MATPTKRRYRSIKEMGFMTSMAMMDNGKSRCLEMFMC
jgi:hypothetical protein